MKINKQTFIFFALAICVVVLFLVFSHKVEIGGKGKVAATIFPVYDIVKNIAGDSIEVSLILPPGASPHTFDLSPKEAIGLWGNKAIFAIGHGLDLWTNKLSASAGIENTVILDGGISFLDSSDPDEPGEDPHYWLSVANARLMAAGVRDELSRIYPEKSEIFEKNYLMYDARLLSLDKEIRSELAGLPNRNISAFHNAWSYFAKEYGLSVAASFEEFPGKEPTPQYLAEFQNIVKNKGIKVIFSEPQFSTTPLEPIVNDLGIKISILDPIGGVAGRDSYESLMRYNTTQIVNSLK